MCERDHKPIGTVGGIPIFVCEDAPQGGVMLPSASEAFEKVLLQHGEALDKLADL